MLEVQVTNKSLASRLVSSRGIAKAGPGKPSTPLSLVLRMPSPEIAAKVGGPKRDPSEPVARRVRRRAQA
jgi:hypothetical protein